MNIIKKFLLAVSAVALFTQCTPANQDLDPARDEFVNVTKLGLYEGAKASFVYSEDVHQIAYSTSPTYQFRIQTDLQERYLFVEAAKLPTTVDETVEVSFQAMGVSAVSKISKATMVVAKSDSEAVWLWCKEEGIGVVVAK